MFKYECELNGGGKSFIRSLCLYIDDCLDSILKHPDNKHRSPCREYCIGNPAMCLLPVSCQSLPARSSNRTLLAAELKTKNNKYCTKRETRKLRPGYT